MRRNHFFYDLYEALGSPKFLFGLLVVAAFFILYLSFQFVYLFAVIFAVVIAARSLIGRRCPHCDAPLKEVGAEQDPKNAFVMHIIWRCPNDGYQEKEETRGDSGLFGAK